MTFETSIRFSSCCLCSKIVYTTSQANKLKSLFLQNNTGDGIPLQAHRGGTNLNGSGSELIIMFLKCSSFLLQMVSFTVDSDPL